MINKGEIYYISKLLSSFYNFYVNGMFFTNRKSKIIKKISNTARWSVNIPWCGILLNSDDGDRIKEDVFNIRLAKYSS